MVDFTTIILQYGENGDKTGWTYIVLPANIAQQLFAGNKRSFRVKGKLDELPVAGLSAMPMGDGSFMIALKKEIRKGIRKEHGAILRVRLAHDKDFKIEMPDDLRECFDYEQPEAFEYFCGLAKSHQGYFIKWITDAKTEETRAGRIAKTINAMVRRMDYGAMLREQKKLRE
ncbi:YdeI/OmpD-associated family protein [Mucilaginibacter lutimaris]|uniref:YdeI/OmpD-associated family protein n=1 Tax=Mucilaginibacter lutimaris TaxID=931629 RepID=A0ABW2ZH55_9SPHI